MYLRVGVHTGAAQAALEHARRSVLALTSADARLNGPCDLVGEDRFLWGSDYPHVDSHMNAVSEVYESIAPMSEARQRLVLGENARRLFKL